MNLDPESKKLLKDRNYDQFFFEKLQDDDIISQKKNILLSDPKKN